MNSQRGAITFDSDAYHRQLVRVFMRVSEVVGLQIIDGCSAVVTLIFQMFVEEGRDDSCPGGYP